MSSFGGTVPEKTWELTGGNYPLQMDVQAAPASPIECAGCKRRSVEGEPILTLYHHSNQHTWRKTYCGVCAKKWYEKFSADMAEAMAVLNGMVEKIGEGFYVAKEICGKDRKNIKGMTKDLIKMCACGKKVKHDLMCLPCDKPHHMCSDCLRKAYAAAGTPAFVNGKYGQKTCPLPSLMPPVEVQK